MTIPGTLWPVLAVGLAAGTGLALIYAGYRGRLRFTAPRCTRCGYDVRATGYPGNPDARCPECGRALSEPGMVTHARRELRPRWIVAGVALLAAPAVVLWVLSLRVPAPAVRVVGFSGRVRTGPTPYVVGTPPYFGVGSEDHWESLRVRLESTQVPRSEIDREITEAAGRIRAAQGNQGEQLAIPAEQFLAQAMGRGLVSTEMAEKLLSATLRWPGKLEISVVSTQANLIWLSRRPTEQRMGHSFQQVFCLREVREHDGKTVPIRLAEWPDATDPQTADLLSSTQGVKWNLTHNLPPGEHQLEFIFDVGAVPMNDETIPRGVNGSWGAARKWPAPGRLWEYRHPCTIVVPGPK